MVYLTPSLHRFGLLRVLTFSALVLFSVGSPGLRFQAFAQEAGPLPEAAEPSTEQQPTQPPAPVTRQAASASPGAQPYNSAIFGRLIPADQLVFLGQFANASSGELYRDRQFHKLMKAFVPDCTFHYGRDMPLEQSLDMVLTYSHEPVTVRDGRYLLLSGSGGPYLQGRGFIWIDMKEGIGLGGFYFHPTNGEPTPTLAVFSRQVKEPTLSLGQLPPAFAQGLGEWTAMEQIEPITTRYFLTGSNRRILLEHDEDFCSLGDGSVAPPGSGCERINAEAADTDESAAYYLQQIHYATNGTAWTIGGDQIAWLQVRDNTCAGGPDPLGCRIRITREHTRSIIFRGPMPRR